MSTYESATFEQSVRAGITPKILLQNLRLRIKQSTGGTSPAEKGSYIAAQFPEMSADTIRLADEALEGMLVLPGTGPQLHFIGNPPLWSQNPANDNEYTFHLNRMHHWKTMCEAYTLTGDNRYGQKVVEELADWIEQNPCPTIKNTDGSYAVGSFDGLHIWRALEVGIRGYRTWPMVLELLIDSGFITEALLEKLLPCVYLHCRVLHEVSPVLWPMADHNHYLMENLGLLSFSCLFPEMCGSEQFAEHAQHELDRCIEAQCTGCGGQIEGCPSYHNGCVFWFALRLVLAEKYQLTVSPHYIQLVQGMFRHSVEATRACGGNFPWGDSHSADKETMSLAAVACYMAFGEKKYLAIARYFYPMQTLFEDLRDNLWRVRRLNSLKEDIRWADCNPLRPDFELFAWQKELNQVFFRSSWDKTALSVMTACRTPVQNLHAHIDAGGFDFTAYGFPLVCDPGIFTYKDCEARHQFKGSLWHNCLTIDRKDMWEYRGSWSYGTQREGSIVSAEASESLAYAVSRHSNYSPAVATRVLAMVDNKFLLVLDMVETAAAGSLVEIGFHLDYTELSIVSNGFVVTHRTGTPNLALVSSGSEDSIAIEEALISTANDVAHPSRIVRYQKRLPHGGDYTQATLLLPCKAGEHPLMAKKPVVTSGHGGTVIELNVDNCSKRLLLKDDRLLQL